MTKYAAIAGLVLLFVLGVGLVGRSVWRMLRQRRRST